MRLDQINKLTARELNRHMLETVGWNFEQLNKITANQASAMLETVNSKITSLRNRNLYESQKNSAFNGLLLAKRVLESYLEEKKAKPDFLDLDDDGNTKEPMKKAVADRKKKKSSKTDEAKKAVEPGAVATAQVKKMGKKYWTGKELTKMGIKKRDEIIRSIEKDQGKKSKVNESRLKFPPKDVMQAYKVFAKAKDRNDLLMAEAEDLVVDFAVRKMGYSLEDAKMLAQHAVIKYMDSVNESIESSKLYQRMRAIMENISEAESIMAAQDMVDRIQGMLEDVGEMINEELPPLIDSIRRSIGVEDSDQFKNSISDSLNTLMDSVRNARESMENAVRSLSGDEPSSMTAPDIDDMGGDGLNMDLDDGDDIDSDEFGASDAATGGDEPLGRATR